MSEPECVPVLGTAVMSRVTHVTVFVSENAPLVVHTSPLCRAVIKELG